MTHTRQREIVIEIERIRLIRKRAKTEFRYCGDCGTESDFLSLDEAARLFETDKGKLIHFISANVCHLLAVGSTETKICLNTFLEAMKAKNLNSRADLIGDDSV